MISSFLLQDIPRHDTRLFEVREAFKRTLLLDFRAYIANKSPPAVLPGAPPRATSLASPVALPATDAGPLINALHGRPNDLPGAKRRRVCLLLWWICVAER